MKRLKPIPIIIFITFFIANIIFIPHVFAQNYKTTQLTNNIYRDIQPDISGGQVVWLQQEGFNPFEIQFYDGKNIEKLGYSSDWPDIDNGQIAWNSGSNLFFFNGEKTNLISTNFLRYFRPARMSSGQVVWPQKIDRTLFGKTVGLFYFDGTQTRPLTFNPNKNDASGLTGGYAIDNGQIAWRG